MRRLARDLSFVVAMLVADEGLAAWRVIAVGSPEGGPGDARLRFAGNDARALAEVLGRVANGGLVSAQVVIAPNRDELLGVLEAAARGSDRDAFLFHFSGHADEEGLWLAGQHLAYAVLRDRVRAIPASLRVVILDACSAGAFLRAKGARPVEAFSFEEVWGSSPQGEVVLASSSDAEASHESEALEGSVFTHFLVWGLRGAADADGDRRVTVHEALAYAREGTLETTAAHDRAQHPTYRLDLSGHEDLVLADLSASGSSFRLLVGPRERLLVRRVGAAGLHRIRAYDGGAEILLEPGEYQVFRRSEAGTERFEVSAEAGASAALDALPSSPVLVDATLPKGSASRSWTVAVEGGYRTPTLADHEGGIHAGLTLGFDLGPLWLGPRLRWSRQTSDVEGFRSRVDGFGVGLEGMVPIDRWGSVHLEAGLVPELRLDLQTSSEAERTTAAGGTVEAFGRLVVEVAGGVLAHLRVGAFGALLEEEGTGWTLRPGGLVAAGAGGRW